MRLLEAATPLLQLRQPLALQQRAVQQALLQLNGWLQAYGPRLILSALLLARVLVLVLVQEQENRAALAATLALAAAPRAALVVLRSRRC